MTTPDPHASAWRDPAEVIGFPGSAAAPLPEHLLGEERDDWWGLLAELQITLLVSREYEHLLLTLGSPAGEPHVTFLQVPHPSGIAVDHASGVVHVACTRNPNQVLDLAPAKGVLHRRDAVVPERAAGVLVPTRSRYYPGSLYLHDLAFIGGELHANAVGHNAIVRLPDAGGFERVWWPRSVAIDGRPDHGLNHLQLNSIAAGPDLAGSWFSASGAAPGARRPGDPEYPVDRLGVLFDGATGEPAVTGLTRPHSARWHAGDLWVDNSGYGELWRVPMAATPGGAQTATKGIAHSATTGIARSVDAEVIARLPGWTRGLAFHGDFAFVGTSRVLPRFHAYAPGLDPDTSYCGIHAVDLRTGRVEASLSWPGGNQIFAIEVLPTTMSAGLPGLATSTGSLPADANFYYSVTLEEDL